MTVHVAEKVRMPFGHYRGEALGAIAAADPLYLAHMATEGVQDRYLTEALGVLADKHREEIERRRAAGERPKLFAGAAGAGVGASVKQLKLFQP